ncbi:MAG: hypothetical protein GX580_07825 [Candidatus Hydrogenedens sp.]|nr:hypothetical protein [Candidatus Hydrogenedentota bacterium]NLF57530.1 hypothetical protein [Candidatus Hydrogenedens sp.]
MPREKETNNSLFCQAVINGIASLCPDFDEAEDGLEQDAEAIRGDFYAIGGDMRRAMDRLAGELAAK